MSKQSPPWLTWSQRLATLAQNGLTFAENDYDRERYHELRDIAAQMLAAHSELESEQVIEHLATEFGYATPKVDVRGGVFREQKILLVRERADNDKWTLPGGFAEVGDTPAQSVIREIREESGFEAKVKRLVAVYDKHKRNPRPLQFTCIYKLFFLCEIIGGSATTSIETSEVAFFAYDEIPDEAQLSLSRSSREQIQRLFDFQKNIDLVTDFD